MDIANDILFSLSSRAEAGHAWHHAPLGEATGERAVELLGRRRSCDVALDGSGHTVGHRLRILRAIAAALFVSDKFSVDARKKAVGTCAKGVAFVISADWASRWSWDATWPFPSEAILTH